MRRLRRFGALVGLASRRVAGRVRTSPQRVVLSVVGVALAIGLMVAVTGVSFGLASESVISSPETDYWIVPEDANVQSLVVSAGGVQLSNVHETSAQIGTDDRVEYAVPVLLELVPVEDTVTGEREYIFAAGVIARPNANLLGLSLAPLSPGDPYYANGSYDGTWTGETMLNDAAAETINASTGSRLVSDRIPDDRSLSVVNVSTGEASTAFGSIPMAVVQLSELQAMTDATTGDQADQILVSTNDPGVEESLATLYPRTTVVERSGLAAQRVSTSNLPLAIAVSGAATAVVVGVLFVATLMGLMVSSDRESLGTLAAVGLSRRSRSVLVAAETVTVALLGGGFGIGLGALGIVAINVAGREIFAESTVARFDPLLVGYALVVAFVIGLLGAIYPVLLSQRTNPMEVLSR
ncbi:ABC transporter permease [Halosimplex rubrum]|uniref:ABC transporter permease n=2 Tax=Halosimplex rubrum TaxID=869889 RepID=A0A7D5T9S4_9EURY|nr:ABC transporter permease [Halosimplex rubrum]